MNKEKDGGNYDAYESDSIKIYTKQQSLFHANKNAKNDFQHRPVL
jgi:hypothetical protein